MASGESVFLHGVASGDPTPTRVIIWTRITRPNLDHPDSSSTVAALPLGGEPIEVRWMVARDMRRMLSANRKRPSDGLR